MADFLNPDFDREKRCGVPEIVYGSGKNADELIEISRKFIDEVGRVIITRIDDEKAGKVKKTLKKPNVVFNYNDKGRVLVVKREDYKTEKIGKVGILSAGTSDIPVAEEARMILEDLGCETIVEYDVGIAGIHRVFKAVERMKDIKVLIVVAGMEGALPSVVSGLVDKVVIAVPTSVGYGTGADGYAALNTMLNSCTPVAVVNIDNGYGAAALAYKILKNG